VPAPPSHDQFQFVHIHAKGEKERCPKWMPLLAIQQNSVKLGGEGRLLGGTDDGFDHVIPGLTASVFAHRFAIEQNFYDWIIHLGLLISARYNLKSNLSILRKQNPV
jgi:hypothetical protein